MRALVFVLFTTAPAIFFEHAITPLDAGPYIVAGLVGYLLWLFIEEILSRLFRALGLRAETGAMFLLVLMVAAAVAMGVAVGTDDAAYRAQRNNLEQLFQ